MNETTEKPANSLSTRTIALRTAAVVLALGALYFGVVWLQLSRFQSAGAGVDTKTAETISVINASINRLREEPGAATVLAPELANNDEALAAQLEAVETMGGFGLRPLPPGIDARKEYQDELRAYVSEVRRLNGQLTGITSLITARTETIQKMAQGFGVLEKLSKPDVTEEEVSTTLQNVKTSVDASVDKLRSIAASGATVYSSEGLITRLSAVSAVISDLFKSLKERDAAQLDSAVQSFSQLMKNDWQSLFVQSDSRGLVQLASSMRVLSEERERLGKAQEEIVSTQTLVGLASLLLLAGAAVAAGFARRFGKAVAR